MPCSEGLQETLGLFRRFTQQVTSAEGRRSLRARRYKPPEPRQRTRPFVTDKDYGPQPPEIRREFKLVH